ncbi:MAG: HEPN domain-containing protein [Elusimicrobia bacterium]|nr:HEPN domain-containing protein [Elusimicrobiota bacterium]
MGEVGILLKKAQEDIKAAEMLVVGEMRRIAVSRTYYAMFYAAEALLLAKGLSFSSHKGVISNFGKEFIKTGAFDKKFQKMLSNAFGLRQNCDYELLPEIDQKKATQTLQNAKEFLSAAEKYIEESKKPD